MKPLNKKLLSAGFFLGVSLINIFIFGIAFAWADLIDAFRPSTVSTNLQYILLISLPIQIYLLWKNRSSWKLLVMITIGVFAFYAVSLLMTGLILGLESSFMLESVIMHLLSD